MSNVEKSAARDQWSLRLMFAGVAWCAGWFALIRWGGPLYYFLTGMAFVWTSLFAVYLYRGCWNAVGMMSLIAAPVLAFHPLVADGHAPEVQRIGWEVVGAAAFLCSIIPSFFCLIVDMSLQKTADSSDPDAGSSADSPGESA